MGLGDGGEAGWDGELGDVVFDEDGILVVAWAAGEEGDDEGFQVRELGEEGAFVEGELVTVLSLGLRLAVLFEQLHSLCVVDLRCVVVPAGDFKYRQQQAGREADVDGDHPRRRVGLGEQLAQSRQGFPVVAQNMRRVDAVRVQGP